jgi:palmitoyl-protein thioesterase
VLIFNRRAVAQRCPDPPMLSLVSLGGQHQGVYGLPNCFSGLSCRLLAKTISLGVYFGLIQNNFVQASYWHDPLDENAYRKYNSFIADINQERSFNADYKTNMLKLKNLVLVKFEYDQMIQPRESQWFGFYKENDLSRVYTLEESPLFLNVG